MSATAVAALLPRHPIGPVAPGVARERQRDELEARLGELAGVVNAATAAMVTVVERALTTDLWKGVGLRSPAHWLSWKAGISTTTAQRLVTVATRLGELPALRSALDRGAISLDVAVLVARHVPVGYDDHAVELAQEATIGHLTAVLRRYAWPDPTDVEGDTTNPSTGDGGGDGDGVDRPDGPDAEVNATDGPVEGEPSADDPAAHRPGGAHGPTPVAERARVGWWWDDEQRFHLSATLPADEGLALHAALQAAQHDAWDAWRATNPDHAERAGIDDDHPDLGLATKRQALGFLAAGYLDHGRALHPHAERYRIHAHLGTDPFGRNQLEGHLGPVLPHHLRRYLTCDATLTPTWHRDGTPLAYGRAQRTAPDHLRKLIEQRDGGCAVPGCPATVGLHIHHIRHWEDGGVTDPTNLVALCTHHHRLHHTGHLPIRGNPHHDGSTGLQIRDRRGRLLTPEPATTAPADPRPHHAGRAAQVAPGRFTPAHGAPESVKWAHIPPNEGRTPRRRAARPRAGPQPPPTRPPPSTAHDR